MVGIQEPKARPILRVHARGGATVGRMADGCVLVDRGAAVLDSGIGCPEKAWRPVLRYSLQRHSSMAGEKTFGKASQSTTGQALHCTSVTSGTIAQQARIPLVRAQRDRRLHSTSVTSGTAAADPLFYYLYRSRMSDGCLRRSSLADVGTLIPPHCCLSRDAISPAHNHTAQRARRVCVCVCVWVRSSPWRLCFARAGSEAKGRGERRNPQPPGHSRRFRIRVPRQPHPPSPFHPSPRQRVFSARTRSNPSPWP